MHGEDSQRSNVVKQSKTYIGAGLSVLQLLSFAYEPYRMSYFIHQLRSAVVIFQSVHAFSSAIRLPLTRKNNQNASESLWCCYIHTAHKRIRCGKRQLYDNCATTATTITRRAMLSSVNTFAMCACEQMCGFVYLHCLFEFILALVFAWTHRQMKRKKQ